MMQLQTTIDDMKRNLTRTRAMMGQNCTEDDVTRNFLEEVRHTVKKMEADAEAAENFRNKEQKVIADIAHAD